MIFCLFGVAAMLTAQGDSRTVTHWGKTGHWQIPVFCPGDQGLSDLIRVDMNFHQIIHFKDEETMWKKDQVRGEARSVFTQESFTYKELNTLQVSEKFRRVEFVLTGEQNSYMGRATLDYTTWEFRVEDIACTWPGMLSPE